MASCWQRGVTRILVPGTQASKWQRQLDLCLAHQSCQSTILDCSLGIHPYFLDTYQEDQLKQLEKLVRDNQATVVAIGEIGLDFAIPVPADVQIKVFERQLALAIDFDLPVIIHHRKSHNEIIARLKRFRPSRGGVIHAFSGSQQEAETYLELGFLLGVGGTITYPRAVKTRTTLSQVPLTSLVLETDAPDMPINGRQGQRNSPEYLPEVLSHLSELRQQSKEKIRKVTSENFMRMFFP